MPSLSPIDTSDLIPCIKTPCCSSYILLWWDRVRRPMGVYRSLNQACSRRFSSSNRSRAVDLGRLEVSEVPVAARAIFNWSETVSLMMLWNKWQAWKTLNQCIYYIYPQEDRCTPRTLEVVAGEGAFQVSQSRSQWEARAAERPDCSCWKESALLTVASCLCRRLSPSLLLLFSSF